ncbi:MULTISPECIES: dynamin family protein [unclassified Coleofasciculus]|uniref:dynamin family protein n=1 Tax=unclassified Coleofasciculus TaxID=2692782 RepID=UPI001880FF5E|nr:MULTISPECIES: dynamin family protein [unclassified Coleofasciculus]MBE9129861.1 dynamin family protein [Coleofasciculus sp. LEGE 07081]MBE9152313.1 dynamin family protein [Coleofasciculus sp. LEGE 07092]
MNSSQQHLTRVQRIDRIIEQRQPLAKEIQRVETHLREISAAIRNLENYRQRLEVSVSEVDVQEKLKTINLSSLIQQLIAEAETLKTLQKRFSRPTLNIGVVGLMGQGKSTLLKSLSGLTDNEIPALEGGACTAVRSTIENRQENTHSEPSSRKKTTQSNGIHSGFYTLQEQIVLTKKDYSSQAKITLHSEESFLREVIFPYYDELGLTDKPQSLDDFALQHFSEQWLESASDEDIYKHLRNDYHRHLNKYRHLIKQGVPQTLIVDTKEIADYVTQKRDGTQQNNLTTFKHLAVRDVKIICPFQNPDVGKIALVDVPGLGDSKLGDEKLMLETLGKEVDVVLFIKRPDPQRYQWQTVDTELYDRAAKALNDLEKRSFMILNYSRRTENLKACKTLQQNIGTIKVVQSEIADCSDSEDANRIFNHVLDYLTLTIQELDQRYASACQSRLENLHHQINSELEKASHALIYYSGESRQFRRLFEQLSQDLIQGLLDLRNQLKQQREEVDPDFEAAVKDALQSCETDTGIPKNDEEIIIRSCEFEFKESYQAIYRVYIRELKIHLSRHFLTVDQGLRNSIDKVKGLVADVLISKGRLGKLTPNRGAEFLKNMADLLSERSNQLELGFRTLWEFEFSYGSVLLHLIRKHLDEILQVDIHPLTSEHSRLPAEPANASEVRENLEKLHQQAVVSCQEILNSCLTSPSQARYYMVQEFIDLVIYARDMKKEWEIFLSDEDIRFQVWLEFESLEKRKQEQQDWRNAVARVAALNQLSAMVFSL